MSHAGRERRKAPTNQPTAPANQGEPRGESTSPGKQSRGSFQQEPGNHQQTTGRESRKHPPIQHHAPGTTTHRGEQQPTANCPRLQFSGGESARQHRPAANHGSAGIEQPCNPAGTGEPPAANRGVPEHRPPRQS